MKYCKEYKQKNWTDGKVGLTECILKNFRLGDAPSATAAITFKLHVISRIATALQKIGKSWNAVIPDVAKFAKLNDNGLTMLRIKNTKTWVAIWLVSLNVAKFKSSSPKSINPINPPEFFSQTKSSWIYISSMRIVTYLSCSEKSSVFCFRSFITSGLKPRVGLM